MTYLTLNQLQAIIVDFTSNCNAMCGSCARNIDAVKVNPNLPIQDMDLVTWKNVFTPKVINSIEEIIFNGSHGDPLWNKNLIPALEYIRDNTKKPPVISIHTNGGLGKPETFERLAELLKDFPIPSHITFSIDGLEDTNHLYRRNVKWDKIMENSKAFIDAGGIARWRMLVFEHNQHQIHQCQQLAYDLGFAKFDINGGSSSSAVNAVLKEASESLKATAKDPAHEVKYAWLEHKSRIKEMINKHGNIEEAFKHCQIQCKWQQKRKIQVSHMGEIFPCCYFLNERYSPRPESNDAQECQHFLNYHEPGWNNVNNNDVETILNYPWFKEYLPNSWFNSNARYQICSRNCGQ